MLHCALFFDTGILMAQTRTKSKKLLLAGAIFMLGSSGAEAAVISNVTDAPVTIEIKTADGFKPVVIETGRTWRTIGSAYVRYNGATTYVEDAQEYAIWKDAGLSPQRRLNRGHRL